MPSLPISSFLLVPQHSQPRPRQKRELTEGSLSLEGDRDAPLETSALPSAWLLLWAVCGPPHRYHPPWDSQSVQVKPIPWVHEGPLSEIVPSPVSCTRAFGSLCLLCLSSCRASNGWTGGTCGTRAGQQSSVTCESCLLWMQMLSAWGMTAIRILCRVSSGNFLGFLPSLSHLWTLPTDMVPYTVKTTATEIQSSFQSESELI